jgi:hypothetical protein
VDDRDRAGPHAVSADRDGNHQTTGGQNCKEKRMRALTTEEAAPRRRVIYVGRAAPTRITRPDVLDNSLMLREHHPGVIDHVSDDGEVFVRFVGLEEETLSDVGWMPDENGRYAELVLVDPQEWEAAVVSGAWAPTTAARAVHHHRLPKRRVTTHKVSGEGALVSSHSGGVRPGPSFGGVTHRGA